MLSWMTFSFLQSKIDPNSLIISKLIEILISKQQLDGSYESEDDSRFKVEVTLQVLNLGKKLNALDKNSGDF